jgi:DNA polymerase IV
MHDSYNPERPLVMHIDLNSCFASIEQQARPLLRGKPVGIVNRNTENTSIVTASYEAKRLGVQVGMRFKEARKIAPDLIGIESDPPKYRYVYHKLMAIMGDYSPHVVMKSIDEGVIDFHQATDAIKARDLQDIGMEIKQRLKDEVGRAMRCNIGISTNRFLAKTAAGLNKPDGMDVIDHTTLRATFELLKLQDLTGIARRNAIRLNSVGIYTPLEFLDADVLTLRKLVFESVCGDQWYERLRGYEVDDVFYDVKSVGRQYVLEGYNVSRHEVIKRLHHLCESVGQRLRSQNKAARGVRVYAKTYERQYWHKSTVTELPFFSDQAIYAQAAMLFSQAPSGAIKEIGVTCYYLTSSPHSQLSIFGDTLAREQKVTSMIDTINSRFGERTIHSADTLGTDFYVKQKVPFGSTRYM